jgi:hypothetical protein
MCSTRIPVAAIACGALLVAAACDSRNPASADTKSSKPAPESPENAVRSRLSEAGLYQVSVRSEDGEIPLGRIHAWVVHLETRDGKTFPPRRLAFSGGMPQHGHGFETEPRATREIGGGDFLIEGVKFHMAGDWMLRVELVGPAGPDVAVFHVQVGS